MVSLICYNARYFIAHKSQSELQHPPWTKRKDWGLSPDSDWKPPCSAVALVTAHFAIPPNWLPSPSCSSPLLALRNGWLGPASNPSIPPAKPRFSYTLKNTRGRSQNWSKQGSRFLPSPANQGGNHLYLKSHTHWEHFEQDWGICLPLLSKDGLKTKVLLYPGLWIKIACTLL